ncbi:stromal processing peptidase, chloroplastic isoform X1 [Amaranthus tricolor]|uniref:stromal processing peptidase, chloroplastic isoform X1 n=1 Tax=Amaranthus tricolor TaxID=29722 RepID=UPI00258F1B1B|nr:stromal processing peptidase, chloroplastic isoform X1 [Amaranthus tricolor]XP_057517631.1 stromal processing peptidase, chloroplastic isoform X1 [Amaranthus tricolor]
MAATSPSASALLGGVSNLQIRKKFNKNWDDNCSMNVVATSGFYRSFSSYSSSNCPRLSLRRTPKCRWSNVNRTIASRSLTMRNNLRRQKGYLQMDELPLTALSQSKGHLCCNHIHRRRGSLIKNVGSRFPVDKSTFPLSKNVPDTLCVKQNHVRCSAVGPDEPHAVSTSSTEGTLEKPEMDFFDPEVRRVEVEEFLNAELPSHPKLYRGQLKNGLRYIILPNKVPPNRFEAHMEVHVGSIDEEDDEQGIAHMIEHVAFLGSKKREKLLGTGARSNAYTDFHHTVFHIHSPTRAKDSDGDLLPFVLDALNEIAFHPKFLSSRVEKERRAILSELQMMNTIEYRVDCQLLQHLHSENKLSKRFPIGLEEQIKKWDVDKIKKFHERWYFPANSTLYIVGDIDDITKTIYQIEALFSQTGLENETEASPPPTPNAFGAMASFLVPKLPVGLGGSSQDKASSSEQSKTSKKERHAVRPPVQHNWSLPGSGRTSDPPQIFQHELLQNFSFNMFCKVPVNKVRTYGDLRNVLMKRIVLSALHFRINTRYKSSNPPFTAIELDHSDSGREGCTVTTLTVTAEPKNWQNAIKVAVQEVRRLKEFGVTNGELARYRDALLKDSEHLAAMIDNVPSVDNLDFIMESDALGHKVMDQLQGHESLLNVAGTITREEVNSIGAEVLEFIADFGKPTAPAPAAIVACVPKKVHIDGTGETDFKISPIEVSEAIISGLKEPIEAEPELEVPKDLITTAQLQELRLMRNPSFTPLDSEQNGTKIYDKETGITQRRLSNGIPVNYKISRHESQSGVMRLIVGGGRAVESLHEKGSVVVGVRTLSEGGRVGNFSREQVELFCVNHLINCSLESTEEFICMEFRFTLRDNGMRAAFQLLHMVLEHSVWLEDAFDRARQLYLSYYRSIPKSLERSTAHKLMLAMLNGDERFVEPTPESLQKLTLKSVKEAVMNQFVGDNMEVSIIGDFSEEEIESCILDYLGTVSASRDVEKKVYDAIIFRPPSNLQFQQVFIKDTDERACAYIAGPAPNRWGITTDGVDLFESVQNGSGELLNSETSPSESSNDVKKLQSKIRSHPLFFGITMGLLAEVINSRLFTTVRDSLGLTYDVSFELNLFDRLNFGWYVISVTSTPGKVHKAVDACKNVLRGLHSNRIAPRELDRAKRTLLMKHEAEIKSNAYWLGLLAHLQADSIPRKDLSCIKDLTFLYEAATIEDVYVAYEQLRVDENSLYSCIGIAGAQAEEEISDADSLLDDQDSFGMHQGGLPAGRGLSTMTRPTT